MLYPSYRRVWEFESQLLSWEVVLIICKNSLSRENKPFQKKIGSRRKDESPRELPRILLCQSSLVD